MTVGLYITYPNVFPQRNCIILFQISPKYMKKNIPLQTSHLWLRIFPGTEQASCLYMEQRWSFWRMHICVIWTQWINELSALWKTEYRWWGNIHVVVNREHSIHTSWTWLTLTNATTLILIFHNVITYQVMFYSRRKSILTMGVDTDWNLIRNKIYRFRQMIPKKSLIEIVTHSICTNIVSLTGVVVVRWALCV